MWYFITILSGFCMATADALTKKVSGRADALLLAWVREAYALPFLLPLLFFIKIPELDATFWIAMAICVAMDMISTVLYMRAIQVAPLSLTVPYLGLTPIFLLIIPSLVLGEQLTPVGILGVILVALGTYTLQLNRVKSGWLEPWLAIFKNRGSFYMLIVAICYALTATLGKLAIQHSSPLIMAIFYFALLAIGYTPFVLLRSKGRLRLLAAEPAAFIQIGLAMALMAITHFSAIGMIQVAYMISIKRLSLLFAILYGIFWFKEQNLKERLAGGLIIIAGATCIAFA
jgi:drug/metabolite transporter (DMT)-like permease